jgi:hypothetical protein
MYSSTIRKAVVLLVLGLSPAMACTEDDETQLKQWGCSAAQIERKCPGDAHGRKISLPKKQFTRSLRPRQGVVQIYSRKSRIAPFRVDTPAGDNYFIKLVEVSDKKTPVLTFFIYGGGTFQMDVPLGTYIMRYAIGKDWYGEQLLFGPCTTSFYEADAELAFTREGNTAKGHRITLEKQVGGNLETMDVDEEQF